MQFTVRTNWGLIGTLLVVGIWMGVAHAQSGQQPRQLSPLEREFMEIQQHLGQVQQKVFANNAELQQQGEALEALIKEKIEAEGVDTEALGQLMRETEERLAAPGLSEAQRREIMASPQVQQAQQQMNQAWEKVSQDPEVVAARTQLEDAVQAAMQADEPKMAQMIQRLEEIHKQLQQQGQPGRR